jgi:hypothetical protein
MKEIWAIQAYNNNPTQEFILSYWYLIIDNYDVENGTSKTPRILYTSHIEEATHFNSKEEADKLIADFSLQELTVSIKYGVKIKTEQPISGWIVCSDFGSDFGQYLIIENMSFRLSPLVERAFVFSNITEAKNAAKRHSIFTNCTVHKINKVSEIIVSSEIS